MNHTDILIHFAKSRGFKSYLEIGVQNPENNYLKIPCEYKCGVDPDPLARWNPVQGWINHSKFQNEAYFKKFNDPSLMVMTSDEFFEQNGFEFDLIFIDGDHTGEQTYKDIVNASRCLSKEGLIVVHDVLPANEKATQIPRVVKQWNGTSYKGFWSAFNGFNRQMIIDIDFGIGVLWRRTNHWQYNDYIDPTFQDHAENVKTTKDKGDLISLKEWKQQEGI